MECRDVLTCYRLNLDILRHAVSFMSVPALLSFSKVNKTFAEWVITYLDLSLDAALGPYFADCEAFRSTMRLYGAVISGSFALQFLRMNDGCDFIPGDLDIYVPRAYTNRMLAYLIGVEGYSYVTTRRVPYGVNEAHDVVIIVSKPGLTVDIIPSMTNSALYPLSHFWASHLVNYISADTFCVAYPELTFWGRSLLSPFQLVDLRHPSGHILSLIDKYHQRAFDFRIRTYAWDDHARDVCDADPGCPRVQRFFGDRMCAVGRLSRNRTDCGYVRGLPSNATVAWWRGGQPCSAECDHPVLLPERQEPGAVELVASRLPRSL